MGVDPLRLTIEQDIDDCTTELLALEKDRSDPGQPKKSCCSSSGCSTFVPRWLTWEIMGDLAGITARPRAQLRVACGRRAT